MTALRGKLSHSAVIFTQVVRFEKAPAAFLRRAASDLKNGAIAVFPTDTVYGIGACSLRPQAVAKIYAIKKRPSSKPLAVLVPSVSEAKKLSVWNSTAGKLAEKNWPGDTTLVLPASASGKKISGRETIALRVPGHKPLLKWLRLVGAPVSATSANLSGEPVITGERGITRKFSGKVDYIFLGGDLGGEPSSVIDLAGEKPQTLRRRVKNFLFVCSGNTCRSVMAAAFFKKAGFSAKSAGLAAKPGQKPPEIVKLLLKKERLSSGAGSTLLTQELVKWAHKIFVMTRAHASELRAGFPGSAEKTEIFAGGISDPYGKGEKAYRKTFSRIKAAAGKEIENVRYA